MSMNLIVISVICLIAYSYGDSNDDRCSPRQQFTEGIKGTATNLCQETKLEKDAANYTDFIFTYKNGNGIGFSYGDGGMTATASARNFPAVIGHNIGMTVVYLKPCGLNIPHIHPRASTISYVAKGKIRSGFWTENTGEFHAVTLNEGQGTAFGKGAIHFEQNIGCEEAIVVAGFNNEDPGTSQITEAMKALPLDVLSATLNTGASSDNIDKIRQNFPKTPALGIEACYKACNIPRKA